MAQNHHHGRRVRPFNGRIFIILEDHGDGEVWPHGIAVAPGCIRSKGAALRAVDRAFEKAVARAGEEWNYDDVFTELQAAGFDLIDPAYWIEEGRKWTRRGREAGPPGPRLKR